MTHLKDAKDVLEYCKKLFLGASSSDEFAEDFYKFAFQDSSSMIDDVESDDTLIPCFETLAEANEKLSNNKLEEGFKIILTPKKKKPALYSFNGKKFVKEKK